jgi:integrase/recombinase XerD
MKKRMVLGQLLLKGLKKNPSKRGVQVRPRVQQPSRRSRNSRKACLVLSQIIPTYQPVRPKKTVETIVEPEDNDSVVTAEQLPVISETPQLPETPESTSSPESSASQAATQSQDLSLLAGPGSMTTQDLVRPGEKLKLSIEGFLMDQNSPHTRRAYGKDLKRFVQFLLTRQYQLGIESLNRSVMIAYKEFLLSEGLEHTTVDRHLATLRSFFKWLIDDGLISRSPVEGVRFLNPKRVSRTIGFSDEEVRKMLTLPDLHRRTGAMHYAILMVLFYCGLRRSELCNLKTTQIGVERNQHVLRLMGKGNAERVIVMLPAVWSAIQYYFHITRRQLDSDEYLFISLRAHRVGQSKKPLDSSSIFYIVTRYAKRAGISNRVSPHSCRATAISNARDHHVPDRAIQEFAGWASPDMITRYDKRKSSIVDSAAFGIDYGSTDRTTPAAVDPVKPFDT